jgi:hypothetical protein
VGIEDKTMRRKEEDSYKERVNARSQPQQGKKEWPKNQDRIMFCCQMNEYELEVYKCGTVTGYTEIESIQDDKASANEAYMYISEN